MPNHRTSPDEYIRKCKELNGDRYDYSLCKYTTSRETVIVICPLHGIFTPVANTHLSKKSQCPSCVGGVRKTQEAFITEAEKLHKGLYSYDKVVYINKRVKVTITCSVHGDFLQSPSDHTAGASCPSCTEYGFNPQKTANLYLLQGSKNLVKVGITNRVVSERLGAVNRSAKILGISFSEVYSKSLLGEHARWCEKQLKDWACQTYSKTEYRFDGYTETFVCENVSEFKDKLMEVVNDI